MSAVKKLLQNVLQALRSWVNYKVYPVRIFNSDMEVYSQIEQDGLVELNIHVRTHMTSRMCYLLAKRIEHDSAYTEVLARILLEGTVESTQKRREIAAKLSTMLKRASQSSKMCD